MADQPTALQLAEAEKFRAEARKLSAEAERAEFEKQTSQNILRASVIDIEQKEYAHRVWLARKASRTIYFFGEVTEVSVSRAMDSFTDISDIDPGCDIEFVINSPGGYITEGMALYDHIQTIKRKGHKVTTLVLGEAASMGGVLLQAGTVRVMSKESWLMLHEAAFGARGKTSQVEDSLEYTKRLQERILDIYASRSNMPKRTIKSKWTRTDWWLSSEEALEAGFIDEVR